MQVTWIYFNFIIALCLCSSCSKTASEEGFDNYKNRLLKIAEIECQGAQSEHFIDAIIDGKKYCRNTNDSIKNQIYLFNSFTTSTPNSNQGNVIEGSEYTTITFSIFDGYKLNHKNEYLYFVSPNYPPESSMLDIANQVFVQGKKWPVSGNTDNKIDIKIRYEIGDARNGFNSFYRASTEFGLQKNAFLIFNKVTTTRENNFVIFDIECSFEADLYTDNEIYPYSNLWGEIRAGKMKARFIVNL